MATSPTAATTQEPELLEAARGGDENAYGRLVEPYRGELHAHCYRMLGSVHDAEDALQDALLRAWRGLAGFEGRSSLRSWLYTIATNTCLNQLARRPKRVLPIDYGPAADPHEGPGEPLAESERVESYVDAWDRGDVDAVVAMLTEDATFAMPPLRTWFGGRDAIAVFLAGWPLSGNWRWRPVSVRANGQPALAFYSWDPEEESYLPFALNVLTLRGARISDVTAFITRSTQIPDREVLARLPEQPPDPRRLTAAFE